MPAYAELATAPIGARQPATSWAKPGCRVRSSWVTRDDCINDEVVVLLHRLGLKRQIAPPSFSSMQLAIEVVVAHGLMDERS
jgi:hypothetical protein